MDNYFTCFRLLTHLGNDNIRATGGLKNKSLRKCNINGDKRLKKRNVATLNSASQTKKQRKHNFDRGWLQRQQGGLHSFV